MNRRNIRKEIEQWLQRRILVLDGAMGSLIQGYGLVEDDFRGDHFRDHPRELQGDIDLLSLTRPDVITEIHEAYLDAGADIIETNTFSATAVVQSEYDFEEPMGLTRDLNLAAARIARQSVDARNARTPENPRFVAGSIGPTGKTLSLSPRVDDPAYRDLTFAELKEAYAVQARALIEGGVDILLVETIFDTLNAKAALVAILEIFEDTGFRLPLMISATVSDASGRTLSGQTIDAFLHSITHADPL
jgi:5-methyltetrahydrofolate--homocysteine methyltransferase